MKMPTGKLEAITIVMESVRCKKDGKYLASYKTQLS